MNVVPEGGILVVGSEDWSIAAAFFVAILILDIVEIRLPRGDSVRVAGALCGAIAAIVSPLPALLAACLPLLVVCVVRRDRAGMTMQALAVRFVATAVACVVATLTLVTAAEDTVGALIVPGAYLVTELLFAQIIAARQTSRSLLRLLKGNIARQAPLLLAQLCAAALAIITYPDMRAWSLIPVLALVLLMRQSYSLLLNVTETYQTTVEVLVEVAEGSDARLAGHADRTAVIARAIATRCGMPSSHVATVSFAALLHGIDDIAEFGALGGTNRAAALGQRMGASDVLAGIEYFSDVIPILRLLEGGGFGVGVETSDASRLSAFVVALAHDVDVLMTPRIGEIHSVGVVSRIAPDVSAESKSKAVSAAVALGYQIPAVP